MASVFAKLWNRLSAKRIPLSIMIVGLDNSGKTSILNSLASLDLENGSNSNSHQNQASPSTPNSDSSSTQPPAPPSTVTTNTDTSNTTTTIYPTTTSTKSDRGNLRDNRTSGNIMPTIGYNYERIQYKNLTITVLDFSGQNRYRNLWQEFYNSVDAIVFVIDSSDLIRLVVVRDELETMLCNPYFHSLTDQKQAGSVQASSTPIVTPETLQKQITINQGKLIQSPLDGRSLTTSKFSSSTQCRRVVSNQQNSGRRRTKVPILFLANKADLANSVDTEVISKALNLNQLPLERHPWFIQATSVKINQGIVEGFNWLVSELSVN